MTIVFGKTSAKVKFFIAIVLFSTALSAAASESARLQLAVAAPDPARAGQEVTYQLIVINDGSTAWDKNNYGVTIELFDPGETFLRKLKPVEGDSLLRPGDSRLFLIRDILPDSYSGRYFYRVTVRVKNNVVFQSEKFSFLVQTLAEDEDKISVWDFNANFNYSATARYYSYKSTATDNKIKYRGNMAFNAMGDMPLGVFTLNMTGTKPEDSDMELYSIYGGISSQNQRVEFGDIMVGYSPLVAEGDTGRGASYSLTPGAINFGLLGMRTVAPAEGGGTLNGTYARYTAGVKTGLNLGRRLNITGAGVRVFDDINSIENPGDANPAFTSDTAGGRAIFNYGNFDAAADAALSSVSRQEDGASSPSTAAFAYSGEMRYRGDYFDIKGEYFEIGPDFSAPASPRVTGDRRGYNASLAVTPIKNVRANYARRYYHDNIDGLPASEKDTNFQQSDSGSITLMPSGLPSLTLRGGHNYAWSDPAGSIDNNTVSAGASMGYGIAGQFFSLAGSYSEFKDKTGSSADLETYVYSVNYSGNVSGRTYINTGYSFNDTKNRDYSSSSISNSASLGLTFKWIPDKLSSVLYNSATLRKDNNPLYPSETTDLNSSLEFSLQLRDNFTAGAGIDYMNYINKLDSNSNYESYGVTLRGLYNF